MSKMTREAQASSFFSFYLQMSPAAGFFSYMVALNWLSIEKQG